MIPSRQEILYRVYGAWRFARLDSGGAQYFEASPEIALRSFFAAVLVAPAFVFMLLLTRDSMPPGHPLGVVLIVGLGYCLLWTVYPVIAHRICQMIDREEAFFRYLAADNWASILTYHFQLAVLVLIVGGVVPSALAPLLELAMQACLLAYAWFIARSCLEIGGYGAAGFVVLQFVVGLFIQLTLLGMLYASGG